MCQSLLVAHAWPLNDLSQGVEHLTGHPDGLEEVHLAGGIDHIFARVVPETS